jgi:tetratricopeptide (TPR) repeat protein
MRFRFWIGVCACAGIVVSAQNPACKGPEDLERELKSQPSPGAYDALGAWFARQTEYPCAISAFQSALRLDANFWEAHYNLGLALLESGDSKRASQELRIAVRQKPDVFTARLAFGTALQNLRQWQTAEAEFKAALKIDAHSVEALDGLTKVLIEEKRYSAAISYLNHAPDDSGLQTNLAIAQSKNGNPDEAIAILTKLAKSRPDSPLAHFNLATIYAQEKRFRESIEEYQETLRIDPSNDVARLALVKALVILAEYDEAQPLIEDYARRNPKDAEAFEFLGITYRGQGRLAEAAAQLDRAVRMQPSVYDSQYSLGFVLAKLGKPQEALAHLQKALELRPDSSEARFQLASVLRALEQPARANAELKVFEKQKQASVSENVASTRANQANEYLRHGDAQRAVVIYRQTLEEDPSNARTYYNLALALEKLLDRAGERQALKKAIELDPNLSLPPNQLGLLELEDGNAAAAETLFKTALSLDPQFAEAQSNLGVLYGQQGKTKEAETLFRQAVENSPQYAQAYVNLGLILAGQDRFAEAEKEIQNAVRIEPNHLGALTALGMVQGRLGHGRDAVENFRKVVTLTPKSPEAHLNLGIALADQYNLEAALSEFSEATQLAPASAAAHYNKGRSLFDLRRNDEAKSELETAVKLASENAPAMYLLGLIEKQADNAQGSAELLEKVVLSEPRNANALFVLGQDYARIGKNSEAIARWKRVLEIDPQHAQALYNLTRILGKSEAAESQRYQARFSELQSKRQITDRAETLGNFAIASAAARDWQQAVAQLKEALDICGECRSRADLRKNLGLIYCRSGDTKHGEEELLEARKLKPNDPEIQTALAILHNR